MIRRAVLTLGGTAAGLAALLSFKTHPVAAAAPADGPSPPAASAPAAPASASPPTASGTAPGPSASKAGRQTASKKAKAAPGASGGAGTAARTYTGSVADTEHGPMQVQVTLVGAKITKVTVVQRTDDGPESNEIDSTAIPELTSETLAAQSAKIDAVSGASYTSSGYIQSLQSALDMAAA